MSKDKEEPRVPYSLGLGSSGLPSHISLAMSSPSVFSTLIPSSYSGSLDGGRLNEAMASGLIPPDIPVEQRMVLLQQIFQQKQADLMLSYQQAQTQLAIQHLKFAQEFAPPPPTPAAAAANFAGSTSLGHIADAEAPNSRENVKLRRTYSHGSSGTISERTRRKLIGVLEKKLQQKEQHGGSPQFEPYPVTKAPTSAGMRPPQVTVMGSDYELRKVSSEPNLKIRQRLREKLIRQRSNPRSPSYAPSAFRSPPAQQRTSGKEAFIFPSPSLPNIPAHPFLDLPLPPTTGPSFNPNLFLSMPSLFPFVHPGVPTLGITLPLATSLDQLEAASRFSASDMSGGKLLQGASLGDGGMFSLNSSGSHPNLLKQQLRDLVLRRKSLVREETEDEIVREISVIASGRETRSDHEQSCRTGLAYDSAMSKHQCMCKQNKQHVEHGGRIHSIWARLQEQGLTERCERVVAKKASLEHLKLIHSDTFVTFFAVSPAACLKMVENCKDLSQLPLQNFVRLPCGGYGVDSDTYFNDATTQVAARLAAGHVIELGLQVLDGRLLNGFAVVRPPGHHAEKDQAMGFCYFNNIAVAVKVVQQQVAAAGRAPIKIAIVDWDVHHGNGTQLAFEKDPNVLYISLHRHDNGDFFPGTGAVTDIGQDEGRYFSINVPWSGGAMTDTEYLAAWRVVVGPVLEQFGPDMIFVSAGFDAARGHPAPLGGYELTARIFGYMTKQLMQFANGRVVLALEGGYDLAAISDASEICVKTLLTATDAPLQSPASLYMSEDSLNAVPQLAAQETLQKVVAVQKNHWRQLSTEGINLSQAQWDAVSSRFASLSV